jgi:quercetin dioxygenase-like cupin family protein
MKSLGLGMTILGIGLLFASYGLAAQGGAEGLERKIVLQTALPKVDNPTLTAITVKLMPGGSVPSHRHGGFVYVYVLEGTVRSQIQGEPVREYKKGESWVEPSGVIHALTENASSTEVAKVLAVFVAEKGATLSTIEQAIREKGTAAE